MRIYTEVIFNWDDKQGKLVETSSKWTEQNLDPMKGEIALCAWETWESFGFDDYGNEYRVRGNKQSTGYSDWQVQIKTLGGEWEKHHYSAYNYGNRIGWIRAAIATITNPATGEGTYSESKLHKTKNEWISKFFDKYGYNPSSNVLDNKTFIDSAKGTGMWDESGKYIGDAPSWVDDADQEEKFDTGEKSETRIIAEESLKGYADTWENILLKGEDDLYEGEIEEQKVIVKRAEEDVYNAFLDIDDEYAKANEEMDESVDRLTGEEGTYTTGLADLEAERLRIIGEAEDASVEGLEDTVTTREEGLGVVREAGAESIRAAEAKRGAAGFAGTGVGQSARDTLSRGIIGDAEDVETAFSEGREDIREELLEGLENIERDFGAGSTARRDLEIGKENALTEYKKIRDDSVKVKEELWETATETYDRELEDLVGVEDGMTGTINKQRRLAIEALQGLQVSMLEVIEGERLEDEGWNPFGAGGVLEGQGEAFGWGGDAFTHVGLEDRLGDDWYEPYVQSGNYVPYDPEYVPSLLESGDTNENQLSLGGYLNPSEFKKSDINIKTDITRISKLNNGLPVYLFRYKGKKELSIGVMAQDVEKVMPEAVIEVNGVKAVNYSILRG
jgi:hypothetical protein